MKAWGTIINEDDCGGGFDGQHIIFIWVFVTGYVPHGAPDPLLSYHYSFIYLLLSIIGVTKIGTPKLSPLYYQPF